MFKKTSENLRNELRNGIFFFISLPLLSHPSHLSLFLPIFSLSSPASLPSLPLSSLLGFFISFGRATCSINFPPGCLRELGERRERRGNNLIRFVWKGPVSLINQKYKYIGDWVCKTLIKRIFQNKNLLSSGHSKLVGRRRKVIGRYIHFILQLLPSHDGCPLEHNFTICLNCWRVIIFLGVYNNYTLSKLVDCTHIAEFWSCHN